MHWKIALVSVVGWQFICFALYLTISQPLELVLVQAYTAMFGDIQASYLLFEQIRELLMVLLISAPASHLSLWLQNALLQRSGNWKRTAIVVALWEMCLLAWYYFLWLGVELPSHLHQLHRAVVGVHDDPLDVSRMMLLDLIFWLVCSIPLAIFGLWLHEKFGQR